MNECDVCAGLAPVGVKIFACNGCGGMVYHTGVEKATNARYCHGCWAFEGYVAQPTYTTWAALATRAGTRGATVPTVDKNKVYCACNRHNEHAPPLARGGDQREPLAVDEATMERMERMLRQFGATDTVTTRATATTGGFTINTAHWGAPPPPRRTR